MADLFKKASAANRQRPRSVNLAIELEWKGDETDTVTGRALVSGNEVRVSLNPDTPKSTRRPSILDLLTGGKDPEKLKVPSGGIVQFDGSVEVEPGVYVANWPVILTRDPAKDLVMADVPVKLETLTKVVQSHEDGKAVYKREEVKNNEGKPYYLVEVVESDGSLVIAKRDELAGALGRMFSMGEGGLRSIATGPSNAGVFIRGLVGEGLEEELHQTMFWPGTGKDNAALSQAEILESAETKYGAVFDEIFGRGGKLELVPVSQVFVGAIAADNDRKIEGTDRFVVGKRRDGSGYGGYVNCNIVLGSHPDGTAFAKVVLAAAYPQPVKYDLIGTPMVPAEQASRLVAAAEHDHADRSEAAA